MRKAICFGLIFAFLLSIGAMRGSATDLSELIKRAGKGEAEAQYNLSEMFRKGDGVPKNTADAAQWYRRAAEQGAGDAQSALGKIYRDGEGVPKNDAEAAKWFRKAAEQDVVEAQTNLGLMNANGQGVPRDYTEAREMVQKGRGAGGRKSGTRTRHHVPQRLRCGAG